MATKQKQKQTALTNWDEELAKFAEEFETTESSEAGGAFFSTKGGILTYDGAAIPGNQMVVIITDYVLENVFYDSEYDPDDVTGPACYAFGRNAAKMGPNGEWVANPVSTLCEDCPNNAWGSGKGRGKACGNRRRLAMIPAGTYDPRTDEHDLFEDPEKFKDTPVAFLKVPPTSVRGFSAYVKQVVTSLRRPPFAVYTKVSLVPDAKTQVKMNFESLGPVPNELLDVLKTRAEEAKGLIEFPYEVAEADEKPAKKKATRKRGARK